MKVRGYLISYGLGILSILALLVIFHSKYPEFFIKKVTETKTEYKAIEGKDAKYCGDIIITGTFTSNRLTVKAEDDCKIGTATFTIGHRETYKHILSFQVANTFTWGKAKNYGGSISYTYLFTERFGLTCGMSFNTNSFSPTVGASILW